MNKMKGIMNLPSKIDVKKTPVNVEETDKAVEKIHEADIKPVRATLVVAQPTAVAQPTTTIAQPIAISGATTRVAPTPPQKEKLVRITIDLPNSLYKSVKIKAVNGDQTLRDYVIGVLSKDVK
jgi:hypothetical protein